MIWLIFAHFIGDMALQSDWQSINKVKYWYILFSHCMIWTACMSIALQFLGIFSMWKVFFLLGGHYICDKWKTTKPRGQATPQVRRYMYMDQGFHLLQCLVVYSF